MSKIENNIQEQSKKTSLETDKASGTQNSVEDKEILPEYLLMLKKKCEGCDDPFVKQRREHYFKVFKEVFNTLFEMYEKGYNEKTIIENLPSHELKEYFIEKEIEHINKKVDDEIKNRNLYFTDPLTGLFKDEKMMEERYNHEIEALKISENSNKSTVLFAIDLNDFKKINDTAGHLIGNAVLKEVANALTSTFRTRDLVLRQGGDEFSVLLHQIDNDKIDKKLEEVKAKLSVVRYSKDLKNQDNKTESISLSLGVRIISGGDIDLDFKEAYGQADQASIFAKKKGLENTENKSVVFKFGDENEIDKNLDWHEQWSVKQNMRNLSDLNKKRSEKHKKLKEMEAMGINIKSEEKEIKDQVDKIEGCIEKYDKEIETRIKIYKALGRRDYSFEQESKTCE